MIKIKIPYFNLTTNYNKYVNGNCRQNCDIFYDSIEVSFILLFWMMSADGYLDSKELDYLAAILNALELDDSQRDKLLALLK